MARSDKESKLFGSPQLGLFEPAASIDPFAHLRATASRLPPQVLFGTSSWTFPGWADLVYHRRYGSQKAFLRESLDEYAQHPLFRTVGIDRSYYSPVDDETLTNYASLLPEGFRCVSKVWSEITTRVFPRHHARAGQVNERFLDPALFDAFARPYRAHFAAHAGPFVVEVPPAPGPVNARGFAETVDRFLSAAGEGEFAFELRDRRLFSPRYVDVLKSHGASHVFNCSRYTGAHAFRSARASGPERPARQAVGRAAPLCRSAAGNDGELLEGPRRPSRPTACCL